MLTLMDSTPEHNACLHEQSIFSPASCSIAKSHFPSSFFFTSPSFQTNLCALACADRKPTNVIQTVKQSIFHSPSLNSAIPPSNATTTRNEGIFTSSSPSLSLFNENISNKNSSQDQKTDMIPFGNRSSNASNDVEITSVRTKSTSFISKDRIPSRNGPDFPHHSLLSSQQNELQTQTQQLSHLLPHSYPHIHVKTDRSHTQNPQTPTPQHEIFPPSSAICLLRRPIQ